MYIYELDALTTRANRRFAPDVRRIIWLFSRDDPQERFSRTVLDELKPMGWTDIQLKRKLYSHDDIETLTFGVPNGVDIKSAFEAALVRGTAMLIFDTI